MRVYVWCACRRAHHGLFPHSFWNIFLFLNSSFYARTKGRTRYRTNCGPNFDQFGREWPWGALVVCFALYKWGVCSLYSVFICCSCCCCCGGGVFLVSIKSSDSFICIHWLVCVLCVWARAGCVFVRRNLLCNVRQRLFIGMREIIQNPL